MALNKVILTLCLAASAARDTINVEIVDDARPRLPNVTLFARAVPAVDVLANTTRLSIVKSDNRVVQSQQLLSIYNVSVSMQAGPDAALTSLGVSVAALELVGLGPDATVSDAVDLVDEDLLEVYEDWLEEPANNMVATVRLVRDLHWAHQDSTRWVTVVFSDSETSSMSYNNVDLLKTPRERRVLIGVKEVVPVALEFTFLIATFRFDEDGNLVTSIDYAKDLWAFNTIENDVLLRSLFEGQRKYFPWGRYFSQGRYDAALGQAVALQGYIEGGFNTIKLGEAHWLQHVEAGPGYRDAIDYVDSFAKGISHEESPPFGMFKFDTVGSPPRRPRRLRPRRPRRWRRRRPRPLRRRPRQAQAPDGRGEEARPQELLQAREVRGLGPDGRPEEAAGG